MAEKVLENQVCNACGVDVRPHSMFCYNCGGAVSEAVVEENLDQKKESNGKAEVSDGWLRDFSEETQVDRETDTKIEDAMEQEFAESNEHLQDSEPKAAEKANSEKNIKLKSAATMRRKAKSYQAQQVEVVWEEPENSSSVIIIVVAVLLTLFAVGIVILALYLK